MILRRTFLGLAASVAMLASLPAFASNIVTYTPDVLVGYVASGEPYLLDFSATWCSTCHAQERVLTDLQSEKAAYQAITILRVDWDTYRGSDLVRDLAIPRRSTLVMMQGQDELGRVVAQTSKASIASLLDKGL